MLGLLLSWVIMSFVFICFGDFFLFIYNKVCQTHEEYNLFEKLILGMVLITLALSVWAFWLPSNHIFLFILLVTSTLYCIVRREHIFNLLKNSKKQLNKLSSTQLFTIILLVFIFFMSNLWTEGVYDSVRYHLQAIRWNEEYAIVKGLANLNEKFGFNSNFFLLSAVFTLRDILGEPIYGLQSLLICSFIFWLLYELFTSRYELKRVIVLFSFMLFYLYQIKSSLGTSTDIMPNLLAFYIIAKILFYQDFTEKKILLAMVIPAFLITLKVSMAPLMLLSIYIAYTLIRDKKNKALLFGVIVSALIGLLWITRNIIISGYIVYPMPALDFFSVLWKVPKQIAIEQKEWIMEHALFHMNIVLKNPGSPYINSYWVNLIGSATCILAVISIPIATIGVWEKRKSVIMVITYFMLLLSIVSWLMNGPDLRFLIGIVTIFIAFAFISIIPANKKSFHLKKTTIVGLSCFVLFILAWNSARFVAMTHTASLRQDDTIQPVSHIFYAPYSHIEYLHAIGHLDKETLYKAYPIDENISLWVSSGISFDMIPSIEVYDDPKNSFRHYCVKALGTTIQEGFYTDKDCDSLK